MKKFLISLICLMSLWSISFAGNELHDKAKPANLPDSVRSAAIFKTISDYVLEAMYQDGEIPTFNTSIPFTSADAFGRFRVSNPQIQFESRLSGADKPNLWDTLFVGTTDVGFEYFPDSAAVLLKINAGAGDTVRAVRQTFRSFVYTPGQSMIIMMTGAFGAAQTNVEKYIGYMSDYNGIYFMQDEDSVYVGIRSNVDTPGTPKDRKISQSNWNIDTMNGSGPSGFILDATKTQIFFIDFEWLGTGTVRLGFVIEGKICWVHKFHHANVFDNVYMSTPQLPIRYEIKAAGGAPGGEATLQQVCSSVITEGAAAIPASVIGVNMGGTVRATGGTDPEPIISFKSKLPSGTVARNLNLLIKDLSVITTAASNREFLVQVIKNGTLTGATWVDSTAWFPIVVDKAATAITGGKVIYSTYVSGTSKQTFSGIDVLDAYIGRYIEGTSEIISIVITSPGGDINMLVSANIEVIQ